MNTKTPRLHFAAALFGAATLAVSAMTTLLPGTARAQTAVTDPVGYLSIALPANSDTFVSIPFTRPAEFTGAVASVTDPVGTFPNTSATITLSGSPGFTTNQFAERVTAEPSPSTGKKTYYLIVGSKNVVLTPTLTVASGTPTTATASGTLPADLLAGDTVTIAGSTTVGSTTTPASFTFTVTAVNAGTNALTLDRAYPGNFSAGLAATYNHSRSEGRFYTVTANDAGTLTVALNGDIDLKTNVTVNTQVSVIPYWTLGTAFPAADAVIYGSTNGAGKSFMASNNNKARGTQILIANLTSRGVNLAPSLNYFFNGGAWRSGSDFNNPYDDALIPPDAYFLARNPDNAPANLTLTLTGSVAVNRLASSLLSYGTTAQDNAVALSRPTSVSLNDLGLITSGVFRSSPSAKNQTDQLLVLDNTRLGINRSSSRIYYFLQGAGWRNIDTGNQDAGGETISAATGFIIRKAAIPGVTDPNVAATDFLQNSRNYLR